MSLRAQIAVLMAANNAEKTIAEAVDSVLSSSVSLQLFIIDDGSSIPVSNVISPNKKISIIRLDRNVGLPSALNLGLRKILAENKYRYIARMDADDICLSGRFEKQFSFMEENPDICLVGCWARFFDEFSNETRMFFSPPTSSKEIRNMLCFNSAICHPTWFMRPTIFDDIGFYNEKYDTAQDYDFLCRLAVSHNIANLGEYLLDYRISGSGISLKKRKRQLCLRFEIQRKNFDWKNWRSYAGLIRTLVLLSIPVSVLAPIKEILFRKKSR